MLHSNDNCNDIHQLKKDVNKLSQRKKLKDIFFKNNTWSSSSSSYFLNTTKFENEQKQDKYVMSPIENRIEIYEQKYKQCMESRTQLSTWIKTTKEKGLPIPLTEGYAPPSRSRLPDFLFSSLSTRPKRKSQLTNYSYEPPTAKSSLSTFLKKASDSLSTTYKQVPPLKRQQKIINPNAPKSPPATPHTSHHRFSLTSSLNRFSLPKNSYNNMTEKYHSSGSNKEEVENDVAKIKQRRHRFSTPPLPTAHYHQQQEQKKQQYNISTISSSETTNPAPAASSHSKKARPQSTILPHSPSSIFLDRLRSRTPCNDGEKQCQIIQPNITSNKQPAYYPHMIATTGGNSFDDDNMTPPSSPSSTDSACTPPLISQYNHRQYMNQRQELFPTSTNHKLTSIAAGLAAVEEGGKSAPKKKRASLLVTPSLSTIRLISQKSPFLKRQSMLA